MDVNFVPANAFKPGLPLFQCSMYAESTDPGGVNEHGRYVLLVRGPVNQPRHLRQTGPDVLIG